VISRTVSCMGLAFLLAATLAMPAAGHHSFAPYEPTHQIKLTGTVTKFTWQNPHVYIELEGAEDGDDVQRWLIECANPGILNRVGWRFNMIQEGDEIEAIVAPLRDGRPGALLKQVTLADGNTYTNGGPAGPALID
jgi:hypothetical protein